jgi:hypothetical protein
MLKFSHTVVPRILALGLLSFGTIQSAQAACPADIANLAPGTWCEVPSSHMRDAAYQWPAGVTFTLNGVGVEGVMDLWSGGAYDTARDRLMVWGGGHNGYGGNEMYAFDVNTLKWQRLRDPSLSLTPNVDYYPDGTPAPRHSYGGMEYLPNVDRMATFSTGGWGLVSNITNVPAFSPTDNTWERWPTSNVTDTTTQAAYDPVTGHVFVKGTIGTGYLDEFDPVTKTWTQRTGQEDRYEYYVTFAIDPVRRLLVGVGESNQKVWDISQSGTIQGTNLSTSGDQTLVSAQAPGFVYDLVSKKFVGWNGGANVYILDPATWTWAQIPPVPANTVVPTNPNSAGTYGRFRYIPSKNAFVVVNSVDQDVFFYKLSSAGAINVPQQPAKPTLTIK